MKVLALLNCATIELEFGPGCRWLLEWSVQATWIGAVGTILLWILGRLGLRIRARSQHLFWVASLAVMGALPLVSAIHGAPWVVFGAIEAPPASAGHRGAASAPGTPGTPGRPVANRGPMAPSGVLRSTPDRVSPPRPVGREQAIGVDPVLLLWSLGVVAVGLRWWRSARHWKRLRESAQHLPPEDLRRAQGMGCSFEGPRIHGPGSGRVEILLGPTPVPVAFGVLRPTVLLPEEASQWSDLQWRAVLEHELGHLAHRDPLTQAIANLAGALLWYHPVVRWIRSRIDVLGEIACDERVIRRGVPHLDYAQLLLDWTRGHRGQPTPSAMLPWLRPSTLERRIRALLEEPPVPRTPRSPATAIFGAMLLAVPVAGLGVARVQPKIPRTHSAATSRAWRELTAVLERGSVSVEERIDALTQLGRIGQRLAFYSILPSIADPDPSVRAAALDAMAGLGCRPAYLCCVRGLRDADPQVRRAALQALGSFEERLEHLDLRRGVYEPHRMKDRARFERWMGEIPTGTAIESVRPHLGSNDPLERRAAADLLRRWND